MCMHVSKACLGTLYGVHLYLYGGFMPTKTRSLHLLGVNAFLTSDKQAFSQDSKSGRQNCTIGPAQMNNL